MLGEDYLTGTPPERSRGWLAVLDERRKSTALRLAVAGAEVCEQGLL
jgi:hypothetical protein